MKLIKAKFFFFFPFELSLGQSLLTKRKKKEEVKTINNERDHRPAHIAIRLEHEPAKPVRPE